MQARCLTDMAHRPVEASTLSWVRRGWASRVSSSCSSDLEFSHALVYRTSKTRNDEDQQLLKVLAILQNLSVFSQRC